MSQARGRLVRAVRTAVAATVLAVAATAVPVPPAGAAHRAQAADEPVGELLTRLRDLYQRTATEAEAHRAAERKLTAHRSRTARLQHRLADTRVRLDAVRDEAGRIARRRYQGVGPFPPHLRLLLGRDLREVRTVFEYGRVLDRMAARRTAAAERLTAEERRLDAQATRARRALDRQRTLTERRGRLRDAVGRRLAEVERRLASLTDRELDRLRRAEGTYAAQPRPGGR